MKTRELQVKYGDIINEWAEEELRIEQEEERIYYTIEQKKKLFNSLEEQGYTKEEIAEVGEYMKVHIFNKEEYFAEYKWGTMKEWFEEVKYKFEEVAQCRFFH